MFCFAFSRSAHKNHGSLKVKKIQPNKITTTQNHPKAITETIHPSLLNSYNSI